MPMCPGDGIARAACHWNSTEPRIPVLPLTPRSSASPSSCFSQHELLDTELGYSWFTEMEKRSYLKDERTTSNAPKGNCLVPVIYVTSLLANADARLQ